MDNVPNGYSGKMLLTFETTYIFVKFGKFKKMIEKTQM